MEKSVVPSQHEQRYEHHHHRSHQQPLQQNNHYNSPAPAAFDGQQDLLMDASTDGDETPTLADPMTLVGAKHLMLPAQSLQHHSIIHHHGNLHSDAGSSNSPHHHHQSTATSRPSSSSTLHHSHIHHHLLPLSSPSPPLIHHHHHASPLHHPLTSPSSSHTPTPPLHHHHSLVQSSPGLWQSTPSAPGDEEMEEDAADNLPSTVDIHAIRDSPSSSPGANQLVTIDENWDANNPGSPQQHQTLRQSMSTLMGSNMSHAPACDEEESDGSPEDSDEESDEYDSIDSDHQNGLVCKKRGDPDREQYSCKARREKEGEVSMVAAEHEDSNMSCEDAFSSAGGAAKANDNIHATTFSTSSSYDKKTHAASNNGCTNDIEVNKNNINGKDSNTQNNANVINCNNRKTTNKNYNIGSKSNNTITNSKYLVNGSIGSLKKSSDDENTALVAQQRRDEQHNKTATQEQRKEDKGDTEGATDSPSNESESESSCSSSESSASSNSSASSDSSSSDSSQDEDDNSDSSSSEEDDEEDPDEASNKPLPRRKPQLVAPEPRRFANADDAGNSSGLSRVGPSSSSTSSSAEDLSDAGSSEKHRQPVVGKQPALPNSLCGVPRADSANNINRSKCNAPTTGGSVCNDRKSLQSTSIHKTATTIRNQQISPTKLNTNVSYRNIAGGKDVSKSESSEDSLFAVPNKKVLLKSNEKRKSSGKKRDIESEFDKLLCNSQPPIGTAPITDDDNLPITIGRGRRKFKPLLPYKVDLPPSSDQTSSEPSSASVLPLDSPSKFGHHKGCPAGDSSVKRVKIEERTEMQINSFDTNEYSGNCGANILGGHVSSCNKNRTHGAGHGVCTGNKGACCSVSSGSVAAKCDNVKGNVSNFMLSDSSVLMAGGIRPTIADLVKVRERRKSFDRDTSSGSEWERRRSSTDTDRRCCKSGRKKTSASSSGKRISRKLSQSSIESSSSYLSESVASDTEQQGSSCSGMKDMLSAADVSTDSSMDSVTIDDDAEPGEEPPVPVYFSDPLCASTFSCLPLVPSVASIAPPLAPNNAATTHHINTTHSLLKTTQASLPTSPSKINKQHTTTSPNKPHTSPRTTYSKPSKTSSNTSSSINKSSLTQAMCSTVSPSPLPSQEFSLQSSRQQSSSSSSDNRSGGGVCSQKKCSNVDCNASVRASSSSPQHSRGEGGGCCYRASSSDSDDDDDDDSSLSDHNIQVDLDTEQTQTFSLTENNLSKGRLTMTIAALKMSKFGSSVLREVGAPAGVPPPLLTRSHLIPSMPPAALSSSRGSVAADVGAASTAAGSYSGSSEEDNGRRRMRAEGGKVKTAAERKTYVDVLPLVDHRKKVSNSKNDGGRSGGRAVVSATPSLEDEDEGLSQLAQHFSQMSNAGALGSEDGLQVLNQEDLAALLPEVASNAPSLMQEDTGGSADLAASSSPSLTERDNKQEKRRRSKQQQQKSAVLNTSSNDVASDVPGSTPATTLVESFMPIDISNVSPDSGIQSVNGSPLHQLMSSPHRHSPLYLPPRNADPLSNSTSLPQAGYSPSSSPPPPILHPAITPPHHPSYSSRDVDSNAPGSRSPLPPPLSPEMPVLKCQVSPPPPWVLQQQQQRHSPMPSVFQDQHRQSSPLPPPSPPIPSGISLTSNGAKTVAESSATLPVTTTTTTTTTSAIAVTATVSTSALLTSESSAPPVISNVVSPSLSTSCAAIPSEGYSEEPPILSAISESQPAANTNKRPRGRPKGSKSKRTLQSDTTSVANEEEEEYEAMLVEQSEDNNKLESKRNEEDVNSNDSSLQVPPPLRPPSPPRVKRPVGRPRKVHKTTFNKDDCPPTPPPDVTNKIGSDQIVHKIINEKIKNSEKSDKLSVNEEADDRPPPLIDNDSHRTSSPSTKGHSKASRRGARTDGIPLEDRKKKRGRRKELPAIFRKVYGSLVDDGGSWSASKGADKTNVTNKTSVPVASSNVNELSSIAATDVTSMAASSKNIHKKKKKKHKQFKTKHKNIVDPAFLASLENLLMKMEGCFISKNKPERVNIGAEGSSSSLPPIFRVKKGTLLSSIVGGKKRRNVDKRTSDRESGTEGDSSSKEKVTSKRKKKLQELPKQGRDRTEANEQRLPLKKRHRHISTAVPTDHTLSLTTAHPASEETTLASSATSTAASAALTSIINNIPITPAAEIVTQMISSFSNVSSHSIQTHADISSSTANVSAASSAPHAMESPSNPTHYSSHRNDMPPSTACSSFTTSHKEECSPQLQNQNIDNLQVYDGRLPTAQIHKVHFDERCDSKSIAVARPVDDTDATKDMYSQSMASSKRPLYRPFVEEDTNSSAPHKPFMVNNNTWKTFSEVAPTELPYLSTSHFSEAIPPATLVFSSSGSYHRSYGASSVPCPQNVKSPVKESNDTVQEPNNEPSLKNTTSPPQEGMQPDPSVDANIPIRNTCDLPQDKYQLSDCVAKSHQDHIQQTLSSTTPKKRHRLEAEMKIKSNTLVADVSSVANVNSKFVDEAAVDCVAVLNIKIDSSRQEVEELVNSSSNSNNKSKTSPSKPATSPSKLSSTTKDSSPPSPTDRCKLFRNAKVSRPISPLLDARGASIKNSKPVETTRETRSSSNNSKSNSCSPQGSPTKKPIESVLNNHQCKKELQSLTKTDHKSNNNSPNKKQKNSLDETSNVVQTQDSINTTKKESPIKKCKKRSDAIPTEVPEISCQLPARRPGSRSSVINKQKQNNAVESPKPEPELPLCDQTSKILQNESHAQNKSEFRSGSSPKRKSVQSSCGSPKRRPESRNSSSLKEATESHSSNSSIKVLPDSQYCNSSKARPESRCSISPGRRRPESRASSIKSRSDSPSKPSTPDLIADTNVTPDKIAQDIIITDGILESGKVGLLDCKVDLYPIAGYGRRSPYLRPRPTTNVSESSNALEVTGSVDSEGTAAVLSESDIASEPEVLHESDQSGFMSDKEDGKEILTRKPPHKRLKKKRELRSPAKKRDLKVEETLKEITANNLEDEMKEVLPLPPPPVKKKAKKRRLNRTGFPAIKRKKKKVKVELETEVKEDTVALLKDDTCDAEATEETATGGYEKNHESTLDACVRKEENSNFNLGDMHSLTKDASSEQNVDKCDGKELLPKSNVKSPSQNEDCAIKAKIQPLEEDSSKSSPSIIGESQKTSNEVVSTSQSSETVIDKCVAYRGRGRRKKIKLADANEDTAPIPADPPIIVPTKPVRERKLSRPQRNEEAAACSNRSFNNTPSEPTSSSSAPAGPPEPSEEELHQLDESLEASVSAVIEDMAGGISCRTRRKRELILEELTNAAVTKKRKTNTTDTSSAEGSMSHLTLASNASGSRCSELMSSSSSSSLATAALGGAALHTNMNNSAVSSEPASSDEGGRSLIAKRKMPRWKKKFLLAGLFSDYYKQNDPVPVRRNGDMSVIASLKGGVGKSDGKSTSLLPMPCYCRKWLMERKSDFQLPFDLWWLHSNNMLPGRDLVPSWNYKKIKSNVFFDVKPSHCAAESQACNCRRPTNPEQQGCGEDCINRMMFIECSPQTCPIPERCSNQRIQKHQSLSGALIRFMTPNKGWGIKVTQQITAGTFILEYVGEVVSEKEFKRRMQTTYVNDTHHYCLNLDGGLVIDGHRMGGDCRFVNHSCEPNCEMQKWGVNGHYRMALYALQDIDTGTELTYDYNFSLFNPAEGQECKCGSENCRGVIGGRSQRVNINSSNTAAASADNSKRKALIKKDMALRKRKRVAGGCSSFDSDTSSIASAKAAGLHSNAIKALTQQQKSFILLHRVFLIRNLTKLKRSKERQAAKVLEKKTEIDGGAATSNNQQGSSTVNTVGSATDGSALPLDEFEEEDNRVENFLTHFTALNTARSVKTRRLAQAEDDPEMSRLAKLAQIFKDIYDKLVASRDPIDDKPLAAPFMSLPSKKKHPNYYTRVGEPMDLYTIERNILTGQYKSPEAFDGDLMRLFHNNLRYFGRNTPVGKLAVGLKKVYNECKLQFKPLLEEVLGPEGVPPPFAVSATLEECESEEEDIIRCVCNMPRDEGLMIQCEKCLVWQHCDCMGVGSNNSASPHSKAKVKVQPAEDGTESAPSDQPYHCEECEPRRVSPEVPMTPQPPDAPTTDKYFITLLRDNLQVKQGDSVYILRDRPPHKPGDRHQPAYKMAKDLKTHDLLIFKIENLWIDEKGDKFAFGHHYLRPHETFHEPWRKFFHNEVIRSPLCDILPLDMIVNHCWVLDLNTYCRGRPIEAQEEHVYVCEYRVDKSARIFSKISKPKYPICTKSYAFVSFPTKLKPQRTYTPHEVIHSGRGGGKKDSSKKDNKEGPASKVKKLIKVERSGSPLCKSEAVPSKQALNAVSKEAGDCEDDTKTATVINTKSLRVVKQDRVNCVASRLLAKLGGPARGGKEGGNLESLMIKVDSVKPIKQQGRVPKRSSSNTDKEVVEQQNNNVDNLTSVNDKPKNEKASSVGRKKVKRKMNAGYDKGRGNVQNHPESGEICSKRELRKRVVKENEIDAPDAMERTQGTGNGTSKRSALVKKILTRSSLMKNDQMEISEVENQYPVDKKRKLGKGRASLKSDASSNLTVDNHAKDFSVSSEVGCADHDQSAAVDTVPKTDHPISTESHAHSTKKEVPASENSTAHSKSKTNSDQELSSATSIPPSVELNNSTKINKSHCDSIMSLTEDSLSQPKIKCNNTVSNQNDVVSENLSQQSNSSKTVLGKEPSSTNPVSDDTRAGPSAPPTENNVKDVCISKDKLVPLEAAAFSPDVSHEPDNSNVKSDDTTPPPQESKDAADKILARQAISTEKSPISISSASSHNSSKPIDATITSLSDVSKPKKDQSSDMENLIYPLDEASVMLDKKLKSNKLGNSDSSDGSMQSLSQSSNNSVKSLCSTAAASTEPSDPANVDSKERSEQPALLENTDINSTKCSSSSNEEAKIS